LKEGVVSFSPSSSFYISSILRKNSKVVWLLATLRLAMHVPATEQYFVWQAKCPPRGCGAAHSAVADCGREPNRPSLDTFTGCREVPEKMTNIETYICDKPLSQA
jgi:hypothetical protein